MSETKVAMTFPEAQKATALPDDPAAGHRSTASVDALYQEPKEVELLKLELVALGIEAGVIGMVVDRISTLERALKPFAMKAILLANAQMSLQAQGRKTEPAGGTWVNALTHTSVNADEQIFFNACDAFGRGRTEKAMLDAFQKIRDAADAQEEKTAHVEDFGKVH